MTEAERERILRILLAASLFLAASFAWRWFSDPEPLFPDVFGFWTFGQVALGPAPASLYDTPGLYALQHGLGMPEENGGYPYPYPPWFMLAVAPLGWFAYPVAAALWRGVTAAFYGWAVRPAPWLIALVAPASIVSFVVGQNGFLTAALMQGGVRLLETRPVWAGALLGAVAYKPQFAVLIPCYLLFRGQWRAAGAAVVTAVALTLLSTALFGPAIWPAWLASMREQAGSLAAGRPAQLDHMATFTSAALLLGASRSAAHAVQAAAALFALWALWRTRHGNNPAILAFATLTATPYAFGYDLPTTTGAALVLWAMPGPLPSRLVLLLTGVTMAPLLTTFGLGSWAATIPVLHALTLWALVIDQPLLASSPVSAKYRKSSGVLP